MDAWEGARVAGLLSLTRGRWVMVITPWHTVIEAITLFPLAEPGARKEAWCGY